MSKLDFHSKGPNYDKHNVKVIMYSTDDTEMHPSMQNFIISLVIWKYLNDIESYYYIDDSESKIEIYQNDKLIKTFDNYNQELYFSNICQLIDELIG